MANNKRIYGNPGTRNRSLKVQREAMVRELEGAKSQQAKDASMMLGTTPAESKKMIDLLRSDVLEKNKASIAFLNTQGISNVISSSEAKIYSGEINIPLDRKHPENPAIKAFYSEMNYKAMETLTKKSNSGKQFMDKAVDIQREFHFSFRDGHRNNRKSSDIMDSIQYFKDDKHGFMNFDLETFGGVDDNGIQRLVSPSEYAFSLYDSRGSKGPSRTIQGVVGINETEAARHMEMANKFRDFGSLTSEEQIAARNYARFAHPDTFIQEDLSAPGRFVMKKSGKYNDNEITGDMIKRGIKESQTVRQRQVATASSDGLMTWHKDLTEAIGIMTNGKQSITGHNINEADLKWLRQIVEQNGPLKKELINQGFDPTIFIAPNRILDTIEIPRYAGEIPGTKGSVYTAAQAKDLLQKQGFTPLSQDALGRVVSPEKFSTSSVLAHTATFDTEINVDILNKTWRDGQSIFDYYVGMAEKKYAATKELGYSVKGAGDDNIFYSTSGTGSNVFSFKKRDNGSYITSDGYEMSGTSGTKRRYGESAKKKGVSYKIGGMTPLGDNEQMIKAAKAAKPSLAQEGLFIMEMTPEVDTSVLGMASLSGRNTEVSYIVGSLEDLDKEMRGMVPYAKKGASGKLIEDPKGMELLRKKGLLGDAQYTANEIIQEGTLKLNNDPTSRSLRADNLNGYNNLEKITGSLDSLSLGTGKPKKQILGEILSGAEELSKLPEEAQKEIKVIKDILSNEETQEGTRNNLISSLDYYGSIREGVQPILKGIESDMGKSSYDEKQHIFKAAMDSLRADAQDRVPTGASFEKDPIIVRNIDSDIYQVKAQKLAKKANKLKMPKALDGMNDEGMLTVNLGEGKEYGLLSGLKKHTGVDSDNANIIRLEKLLRDQGVLKGEASYEARLKTGEATPVSLANEVIRSLRQDLKESADAAGMIGGSFHNVMRPSDLASMPEAGAMGQKAYDSAISKYKPGFIKRIPLGGSEDAIKSRTSMAQEIVENFMMQKVPESTLIKDGYTAEQIKKLRYAQSVRRDDYTKLTENVLDMVSRANGSIIMDPKTNTLGAKIGEEFVSLDSLPRDRYEKAFFTEVNGGRYSTVLMPSYTKDGGLRMTSSIGESMRESYFGFGTREVEKAIQEGRDPVDEIVGKTKQLAKLLREESSIQNMDAQDAKSQFMFNEKGMLESLPEIMKDIENAKDITPKDKEALIKIANRKTLKLDKLSDTERQVFSKNRGSIYDIMLEGAKINEKMFLAGTTGRGKASAISRGNIQSDAAQYGLEAYNNPMRGIEASTSRAFGFRKDLAEKSLIRSGALGDVSIGSGLRTKLGHSQFGYRGEGIDASIETEFTVKRAIMSPKEFSEKITKFRQGKATEEDKAIAQSLVTKVNLTEGGAAMDPRLSDAFYQYADEQRIRSTKKLMQDHYFNQKNIDDLNDLNRVVPVIEINPDGTIGFRYQKGRMVSEGENLITLQGYGNRPQENLAKYDGNLKFGYYTKKGGVHATQDEVLASVMNLAKKKGTSITDSEGFIELAEELYDGQFALSSTFVNPYVKVSELGLEKHMTTALYGGLGDTDDRVGLFLDDVGLGKLRGKTLAPDLQQELTSQKSFLNGLVKDLGDGEITGTQYDEAVKKHFGSYSLLEDALQAERYAPGDVMKKIADGAMYISNNPDIKHKNYAAPAMSAVETMIMDEQSKIAQSAIASGSPLSREAIERTSRENIVNEIGGAFIGKDGAGLSLSDDGKIVVPEMSAFDNSRIDGGIIAKAYDKRFGQDAYSKILDTGTTPYTQLSFMKDSNRLPSAGNVPRRVLAGSGDNIFSRALTTENERLIQSSKGSKFSQRDVNSMSMTRMNQGAIDDVYQNAPGQFDQVFGHAVDYVDGKPIIKPEFDGKLFQDNYMSAVKRGQFLQMGEAVITPESAPSYLKNVVERMAEESGGPVGLESAEKVYSVKMNRAATQFNLGKSTPEEMIEKGFKVVGINDIPSLSNGMEDWHVSGIPDNMLIDLSQGVGMDKLNEMGLPQYMAIGKTPFAKVGDEVIASAPLKNLSTIARSSQSLSGDTRHLSNEEYSRELGRFRNAVTDAPDTISAMIAKKGGLLQDLSEVRLENSFASKASLMSREAILAPEGREMLKDVMVGNTPLLDLFDQGTDVGFKLVSREQFEEMGYFKPEFLAEKNITSAEMEEVLRGGIPVLNRRYPTNYEGSVRAGTLALSDSVKGKQGVEFAADLVAAKGDADGDSPDTLIPTFLNKDGSNYSAIDIKIQEFKANRGDGKATLALEAMEEGAQVNRDIVAQQLRNASSITKVMQNDLDEAEANLTGVKGKATILSGNGSIYPSIERTLTSEERNLFGSTYEEVENMALRSRASEFGGALSPEESLAAARKDFSSNPDLQKRYMSSAADSAGERADELKRAIRLHMSGLDDSAAMGAKVKQAAAGQIDLPLQYIKDLSRFAPKDLFDSDEWSLLANTLEAAGESYLSPKHGSAKLLDNTDIMESFTRSIGALLGKPQKGDQAGGMMFQDWLAENATDRIRAPHVLKYGDEESAARAGGALAERLVNSLGSLDNFEGYLKKTTVHRSGFMADALEGNLVAPTEDASMLATAIRASGDMPEASITRKAIGEESGEIAARRIATGYAPPASSSIKEMAGSLAETFKLDNIRGRDLAIGALGIAGAIMAVGFVGGNPSAPAEMQAQDMDSGQYYEGAPILSDEGLEVYGNGGGSKGYIININANSKKGKKYTEQAIQQAMSDSYNSTNINISMNTRGSAGNITDRNIEEIIRGSFA